MGERNDERRHLGDGRRFTDRWAHQAGAVALLLSLIYAIAAWGIPLASIPKRVELLEQTQPALLLMTCVLYQDGHPTTVPAVCDQAIRRGR